MHISRESRKKVKNLAKLFTSNTPILCEKHIPDGLPIDKNDSIHELSSTHPAEKFNCIVEQELSYHKNRINTTDEALKYCIEEDLREIFENEYFDKSDKRSCIKCYEERLNNEHGLPIRMIVPEKYDNINIQ